MSELTEEYFVKPATELAPDLLGKYLCRKTESGEIIRARITETEAYFGEEDTACHAHRGKTPRTETLYRKGGCTYVYLCYGIHSLLNIVSGEEGHPEAVLIRGVDNILGPGRVTKHLNINKLQNGLMLSKENGIWIENGDAPKAIRTSARVGIDYADEADRTREWRFIAE